MRRKRTTQKKSGSKLKWSFIATVFALVVIVAYILANQGLVVNKIPDRIHFSQEGWMNAVPSDAVFVERFNVTRLLQLSSQAIETKNGVLINTTSPKLEIKVSNIQYLVVVGFNGTPGAKVESTGVQILIPDNQTYTVVSSELENSNPTPSQYNGFPVYSLTIPSKTTGIQTQYLALANHYFIYQPISTADALDQLYDVLNSVTSPSHLIEQPNVIKTLGLLETLAPSNIGLSLRTFPGVINSQLAGKIIGFEAGKIRETSGLMFSNSSAAVSEYDHTLQAYYGSSVDIYDNFLIVTKYTNSTSLTSTDFSP